ncbi:hypothetical protein KQ693_10415 [Thermus sp. PS18]|uniref:hypothetical protein n=1 Tax=Thermus sp. PS18 TaxID=2849039 RepID=UPI0022656277|nr:hypothetical protein [Thermus sp. PS18]UZX15029.1 hypothetical protein KQ693_10415 [Thermus sp. PS18]
MLKLLRVVYFATGLAVLVVEDLMDGVPGIQKKAEAIGRVKDVVMAILGFWPAWIPDSVLGWVIDTVVGIFNRDGTFRKGEGAQGAAVPAGA